MTHSLLNQAAEKKISSVDQHSEVGFGSSALSIEVYKLKKGSSQAVEDILVDEAFLWITIAAISSATGSICGIVHSNQMHTLVAFPNILAISLI